MPARTESSMKGPRQNKWRIDAPVLRRQAPPTMLDVPPARLPIENQMRFPIVQRAAPAIHGPTTSTHH
jgi:hypothetical protein